MLSISIFLKNSKNYEFKDKKNLLLILIAILQIQKNLKKIKFKF